APRRVRAHGRGAARRAGHRVARGAVLCGVRAAADGGRGQRRQKPFLTVLVLDPAASARGFRLTALDEVDSTNAEALRRGRMGDGGPLWVVAKVQTAGRGRRGRSWASPDGNLFASLLLTETASPERASLLGLVAGLAVTDAVTACAPDLDGR